VRHQSVLVGGIWPSHGTCSSPRCFILDLSFLSLGDGGIRWLLTVTVLWIKFPHSVPSTRK
jgi:hypothetical protein